MIYAGGIEGWGMEPHLTDKGQFTTVSGIAELASVS